MIIHDTATPAGYVAPCIEQVLSAEDVEREVHYAGFASAGDV